MSIASSASEKATSSSSGRWRASTRERLTIAGALVALCALLTACGARSLTPIAAGASATATLTATTAPATTTLRAAPHVSTTGAAALCNGAFGPNARSVYAFSKTLYAEATYAPGGYPSYLMPASAGAKPFKLGDSIGSPALDQLFGGAPNANPHIAQPGGVLLTICDNSAQPVTITGAGVAIMNISPHASPIDTWQICDGAYQPGTNRSSGGCGGGFQADEIMSAAFPASASQGATVNATMNEGSDPLPITITPGATMTISIAITIPTTPGIYTLALTLAGTDIPRTLYAPLAPQLFAPVAHQWNGENCKAPAMLSQIPQSDTSSYFICPA
jgi:hypothetical protein